MPQLKIYEARQSCDSYLPRNTGELLGARPGRSQGDWYVVAYTAAEAVEIAQRAGIPHVENPRHLRVWGKGNDAERLKAHGHLVTHGEVITHLSHSHTPVAKFTDNGWLIIGRFAYDRQARDLVFQPKEA